MPLDETDIDRIYLAGQSGSEATLAVASVIDGHLISSATKLVTFDNQKINDVSTVTHIFRQNYQLLGLTSVETSAGRMSQIGVWRLKLTAEGRPRKGGVIQLANTASGSVSGVLPSFENDLMHLMIQDFAGNLTYLVIDIAYGKVARATPISQSSFGVPVMSLLSHSMKDRTSTTDLSATIITTESQKQSSHEHHNGVFIHRATFSQADTDEKLCDWQMILESMHIAFMQREALRFEADFFDEMEMAEKAFVGHEDEASDDSAGEDDASDADDSSEFNQNSVTGLHKT